MSKNFLWISMVGVLLTNSIYAGINDTGGSNGSLGTTNRLITPKSLSIQGASYTSDTGNQKDLIVRFTSDELYWLSQIKKDSDYQSEVSNSRHVLIPVAEYDICLDASLKAHSDSEQLQAKASIGDFTNSNSEAIRTYVMIKGSGSATTDGMSTASSQYLFFSSNSGTDAQRSLTTSSINSYALNTNIDAPVVTDTAFKIWPHDSNVLTDISQVDSDAYAGFNHYHMHDDHYALTATQDGDNADADGGSFKIDKSSYDGDSCGTGNGGVVTVTIYLSVNDILSYPADTYNGTVDIAFQYT